LGQSPSQNQIWCILALKSDSGGNYFNDFAENQLTCVPKIFLSEKSGVKVPGKFMGVI